MLNNRPRFRPRPPAPAQRRPIGPPRILTPANRAWRSAWPLACSSILGCTMLQCAFIVAALEIASLVKSTDSELYGNTSSTGAGLWCGFFFFIGAVTILVTNLMHRVHLGATLSLFTTMIAAMFACVLVGLDAKAVADRHYAISYVGKVKILAAQLAFGLLELLICTIFIIMYIIVAIIAAHRKRRFRPEGV